MRRQRMCERLAAPLGTTDGVAGESASITLSRSKPTVSLREHSLIRGLQAEELGSIGDKRMCERLAVRLMNTDGVAGESALVAPSNIKPTVSLRERSLIRCLQVEP